MTPPNSKLKDTRLEIGRWHDLMAAFGMPESDTVYHHLIAAYSESHRAYHTLDHIAACFAHLDTVSHHAKHPHEIELALWFHDAVYEPFSTFNEDNSADMAKSFLEENNVQSDIVTRIYDLIILTKDHALPSTIDGQLMLDIDLSILGADEAVYAQFEKDVRKEYKRVPSCIFKKKRKEILQGFLARPRIYQTDYFHLQLEAFARKNLAWAIEQLK